MRELTGGPVSLDENKIKKRFAVGKEEKGLKAYVEEKIKDKTNDAKKQVIEIIAENIARKATEILTGIGLFIVLRIILIILKLFSETLEELPIVKQFNEFGGVIYGILKSIVIIVLMLTVLYFIVCIKPNGVINLAIENSYITKLLYTHNVIIKYCLLGKNLL